MDTNDNQQELIDQFLSGELQGIALNNFLQKLKTDPELQETVKYQEEIILGIEHNGNENLRNRLRAISKETKESQKAIPASRKIVLRILSAAAVIACLFVASTFVFNNKDTGLSIDNFEPFDLSITRNGEVDSNFAEAEQLYSDKNYLASITIFEKILKDNPKNPIIELALGNAFIKTKNFDKAKVQFQNIIQRNDPLYTDQANWFLALTYLKNKEQEKGKSILESLAKNPNADFHKEAKAVLKTIK